ncbi:LamG-like jellyroll fold domain-containing protein [Dethiosulfatarculus sandiegensis]|uniref:LamG-like jellyroll fold domain-containing protein n=1 Tax=Dethiosulfatarculus sandiegensis TaxID=1429043 RepID=A0A0D2HMX7_9BACT|nr:LamG-like jellyroll fold domain-containing protein [Dethiosulfatarculus sandiegensis]KIX11923.1 hypothetical protein X474_21575 [Dethiosulfatarculus sandiegensis]
MLSNNKSHFISVEKYFTFILFSCAVLCLSGLFPLTAQAQPQDLLNPGIYQWEDFSYCEVKKQDNGSFYLLLRQGTPEAPTPKGFAFYGRLVPDADQTRYSVSWQALPSSCCPGRGRAEIELVEQDKLSFVSLAPSSDRPAWSVKSGAVFVRTGDLKETSLLKYLAGSWNVSWWYTDLLPGNTPADPGSQKISFQVADEKATGVWPGTANPISLTPSEKGIALAYKDGKNGYELTASLLPEAGGLSLNGSFYSTLGRGRMVLVRNGLPANPPGNRGEIVGGLSGTWVDPRTGNDFFRLKGTIKGFDFTAYGGSRNNPRYLTKGRARPDEADTFQAFAKDVKGHCCGNQGRMIFKLLTPTRMEVKAVWWPQGTPDPQTEPGSPYIIEKISASTEKATVATSTRGRWPVVTPRRPGLLPQDQGAVKAIFSYSPQGAAKDHTIFSQGGYLRDFDFFIDTKDKLAARIACQDQELTLRSQTRVTPEKEHQAWLVYQVGKSASLYLDGKKVAEKPMPTPWLGSNSPYIMGASRWPQRSFDGKITSVSLWPTFQDPLLAMEPALTIDAPQADETGQGGNPPEKAPETVQLVRFWNPTRLIHAYAVNEQEITALQNEGFVKTGPVGRILTSPHKDATGLWAFTHRSQGYTILLTGDEAPATPKDCDRLGRLGYVWTQAAPENTQLFGLQASFSEPVRRIKSEDLFYTTSRENAAAAREAGYGPRKEVAFVLPERETPYKNPLLYDWSGAYRGEGWGRFFISQKGNELYMFWYYGGISGPHYFGRYTLGPDNRTAEGIAVGRPGSKASYYRHRLVFDLESEKGPSIRLTAWRMAAPLDDGRLVLLNKSKASQTLMIKTSQKIPAREESILARQSAPGAVSPAKAYEQAVQKARQENRLEHR